jgi:hypothetical protein
MEVTIKKKKAFSEKTNKKENIHKQPSLKLKQKNTFSPVQEQNKTHPMPASPKNNRQNCYRTRPPLKVLGILFKNLVSINV